jgi:hypothetical protein
VRTPRVEDAELHAVEDQLERAFRGEGEGALRVIGYGEISCVVALDGEHGPIALKRLPPFSDRARFEAYRACFDAYLAALASHGIEPVPSVLLGVARGGRIAAFVAQPRLEPTALVPAYLRAGDEARALEVFEAIAARVTATVGPGLGLDGQLSNWVWHEGAPRYLDVTTPLLRDASGAERLDTELFMISLPWALRPLVRRLLLGQILDKYYEPRGVLLDLLGNLLKEKLAHLVPALLPRAAAHASPPITDAEVRAYYAEDARMWALLQRLRRTDRAWQQRVRRRPYPFLLPARYER